MCIYICEDNYVYVDIYTHAHVLTRLLDGPVLHGRTATQCLVSIYHTYISILMYKYMYIYIQIYINIYIYVYICVYMS